MISEKLRNTREFRRVYEQGQRFHTPYFSVFILPTESARRRLGFTVTRKIGNAVIRNRCKRRLREAARMYFRSLGDGAETCPGYDLVINAKSDLVGAGFGQIEEAFGRVMAKFFKGSRKPDALDLSSALPESSSSL